MTGLLLDQLGFYLDAHLFPRLEGLSDAEYFWEPVPGCWSVREGPHGWFVEQTETGTDPTSVTTIAWRLAHIAASNLGTRAHALFGPGPRSQGETFNDPKFTPPIPATAADAVALLHETWAMWRRGVADLGDARLLSPIGPIGGPFASDPFATLVLHVSRETMHHGGEIGVLRDLYRAGTSH